MAKRIHVNRIKIIIISFIVLFFTIDILDTYIVDKSLEKKLAKLHASGLYIKTLKRKETFFILEHQFLITLQKSDLASEMLLGLSSKDPFSISLAQYEDATLKVTLTHTRYIFSHQINMEVSIEQLPESFSQSSLYFDTLLNIYKMTRKKIFVHYALLSHDFTIKFLQDDQSFPMENNTSFTLKNTPVTLTGNLSNNKQYRFELQIPQLSLTLLENNQTNVTLKLKAFDFSFQNGTEKNGYFIKLDEGNVSFYHPKQSHVSIKKLNINQYHTNADFMGIYSTLNLQKLDINTSEQQIGVDNFAYNIDIQHLDKERMAHITTLIDSSNNNDIIFVFDELSKSISAILRDKFAFHIHDFSFDNLSIDHVPYGKNHLNLNLNIDKQAKPALGFDMNLTVSQKLFKHFINLVPNANLSINYLDNYDQNASHYTFQLQNSTHGLLINHKPLSREHNETRN